MRPGGKSDASPSPSLRRDRRGVALIEAAFVLPPFLVLLFLILEVGIYFMVQSSLDLGVLATAETLQTSMAAGSSFVAVTDTALKTSIAAKSGGLVNVANLTVDVQQLSTLSTAARAIGTGTDDWGGSGSILIVRALTTTPYMPGSTVLPVVSTSVIRRPPY